MPAMTSISGSLYTWVILQKCPESKKPEACRLFLILDPSLKTQVMGICMFSVKLAPKNHKWSLKPFQYPMWQDLLHFIFRSFFLSFCLKVECFVLLFLFGVPFSKAIPRTLLYGIYLSSSYLPIYLLIIYLFIYFSIYLLSLLIWQLSLKQSSHF